MIDPDKPLTLGDLLDGLDIDADFVGWDYGSETNELTVKLKFGDRVIASTSVTVSPAGFEKEKDRW